MDMRGPIPVLNSRNECLVIQSCLALLQNMYLWSGKNELHNLFCCSVPILKE